MIFTYVFLVTICNPVTCEEYEVAANISGPECLAYAEAYFPTASPEAFGMCQIDTQRP